MKSRTIVFFILAAALLSCFSAGCHHREILPPVFVSVPDTVFAGNSACVRLFTQVYGYPSIGYIINWGDTLETHSGPFVRGDTATVFHVWSAPGVKQVRVRAFTFVDTTQLTDWSETETVAVVAGGSYAPVIDSIFTNQTVGVVGVPFVFTVLAHDPDGDSLRLLLQWDPTETTSVYVASPCSIAVDHVFAQVGTAEVIVSAQDAHGALSLPDTVLISVGTAGSAKWYWQSLEQGIFNTSLLCQYDGQDECVYASCFWDEKFYSLRVRNGKIKCYATPRLSPYVFTGQPAFCAATEHFILGSEEGELYALGPGLALAWRWPNAPSESLEPMVLFGTPAIRDNRLYVPREDDSLYYFIDSIDHGVRVATFPAGAGIVDAPAIDAQGNVYFGTDSGYLCKVGPELDTLFWRAQLTADGGIHSLIIGGDGTIFCSSELSRIYAIDPATGSLLWTAATEGLTLKLAAGRTAIFAGTDFGAVYSINPATGSVNWRRSFGQGFGFRTAPIIAARGYMYVQDDNDVLYCLHQLDGKLVWACDCNDYLPGGVNPKRRRTHFPDYDPSPTITSTGDIIVPGRGAVFCIAGYTQGPLDPLAPWPKWQHDLYDSGYVSGGR